MLQGGELRTLLKTISRLSRRWRWEPALIRKRSVVQVHVAPTTRSQPRPTWRGLFPLITSHRGRCVPGGHLARDREPVLESRCHRPEGY
jgi:hypothetical protein